MEVFLKLLHQLRGKGRKILLAQTDNQKVTGDDVVDLAVSVPQRTIQVFPHDFSLIVHHQCDRLIKRVNSFNVATDSFKYIPKRKLYRYRKCIDRELNLIEENAVWISNPDTFADPFDSTIPVQELEDVDFYYPFLTGFEITYIQKYIEIFRNSNIKQPARHYTRRLFLHLIDYGRIAN